MTVAASMIPGLDEIVRSGDPKRRAEAARQISQLFFQDAANLRPDHVDLFDGMLIDLVPHADLWRASNWQNGCRGRQRAARAGRPAGARERDLVAGPLLRRSPVLDEQTLLEIARVKGQGHLLAMSERKVLSPDLTDVIVQRGDRDVVRRAAGNNGALFSEGGYAS